MGELNALLRWVHILAGIIWIGHLYFFNFVNGPFQATLDGPTKKAVNPQLLPRALYWFRWGAAWTWVTGLLLMLTIFYMGHAVMGDGGNPGAIQYALLLLTIVVAPVVYDTIMKSGIAANMNNAAIVGLALSGVLMAILEYVGGFGYRGVLIHFGAMFGTAMAFNVWMRIWPAQQKIITAVRDGQPPDPALVALAGGRSRQNVFMSVPLIWAMMNEHSTAAGAFNMGSNHWVVIVIVTAIAWQIVTQLYAKAAKVQGF